MKNPTIVRMTNENSMKWKYLSGIMCVINVIIIAFIVQHFNQFTVEMPSLALKTSTRSTGSMLGASITGLTGQLFKMDMKMFTFDETKYAKIQMKPSNKKLKFTKQCESDYWIVLTTIFNVTSAILDYNNINNWCTIIIGDKKSIDKKIYNTYLNTNKVVYLDVNDQNKIFKISNHFKIFDNIPFNHFARKNLGFLYAIMNGAKYIYDTDDDNKVLEPYNKNGIPILGTENDPFEIKEIVDDRINDEVSFNIFLLWSNEHIWPRGYDIAAITDSFKWHKTVNLETKTVNNNNEYVIQQWLSNIEPDYDAIERLIGKNMDFNSKDFTMEYLFDINENNNFAVSIPSHLYIPFNAQMTVWDYRSFLFLYLPISVHGRVSDIWRAYFADTVMNILNINKITNWKLLYCPVLVNQYRNSHNYLADFHSELPLYLQTHQLLKFLHEFANNYKVDKNVNIDEVNIGQILLDLYISLYEYGIIKLEDVKGIHAWINDIVNKIGWNQNKYI
eukprot:86093_1